MCFGPPKILQSDNGTEFKGALSILLQEHGIKVINGCPHHPQSQGMVKHANGVLKEKIAA
jgi:IS30 family transposase